MQRQRVILAMTLSVALLFFVVAASPAFSAEQKMIPVKGKVTLVDLGAASCIPCKMMAPILDRLEKRYQGKAAVIFIDLRYEREAARHFGIRAIPTQIFFDKTGQEVYRHVGFMSEEAIVAQFQAMGVK